MKSILICLVVTILLGRLNCQLTGITLAPSLFDLNELHLGNFNLSSVTVVPLNTPVSCMISEVGTDKFPSSPTFVAHPFQKSFQFISPNNVNWYFFYDASSPHKLNYTVYNRYDVTVQCTTGNELPQTAVFIVNITSNTKPTVKDAPGFEISFDAQTTFKGHLLYTVVASDIDGDAITYKYTVNPPEDIFDINPTTNEIKAKVNFAEVGESPVTLTLEVSDGQTIEKLDMVFDITNRNQRPEITNLPKTIPVLESTPGGTEIIVLTYQDPDQTILFLPDCIISPNTQPSVFNITGSRISLTSGADGKSLLDYEGVKTYQIDCVITDQFLFSKGPDILTINVGDTNESPEFNQQNYTCQLQESMALDSTCSLNLLVNDPENQPVTISIKPTVDSQRFRFTSTTADRLTFAVDYDIDNNAMPSSLAIEIEARDSAGQTATAQVFIEVSDTNDNPPVFDPTPTITLYQTAPFGVQGMLQASDADSGTNAEIQYSMVQTQPTTASQYFSVQPNGEIRYIKKYPDSLKDSTVLMTVQATDKGLQPKSDTGTVTLRLQEDPSATTNGVDPSISGSTQQKSFLDEPANIAMVAVIGLILLVVLLIAFYFCIKKIVLGYCCGPRKPPNVYPEHAQYGQEYKRRYGKPRGDYPDYHRSYSNFHKKQQPGQDLNDDNRSMQPNIG